MSTMNRREALRSLLTGALQTAGTVVLACSALPAVAVLGNQWPSAEGDLQERADRLACEQGEAPEGAAVPPPELLGAVQLAWPAQAGRAAARPAAR